MKRRGQRVVPSVPGVEVIPVEGAARLVTLEDPETPPEAARGAFARIRPPEGTEPHAVSEWREQVSRVALAVRVMAAPQAADVPLASTRVDVAPVGTFREEALRLAKATKDPDIEAFVLQKLDEAGA